MQPEPTIYDQIGGEPTISAIVNSFYDGVATDDILRSMYPEDLAEPRRHLTLFFCQYFGGPKVYEEERGHPRLRMRHAPFVIGEEQRDRWLHHMLGAMRQAEVPEPALSAMITSITSVADFLVNAPRTIVLDSTRNEQQGARNDG